MQLKIYQISHPIVQIISNNIENNTTDKVRDEIYYRSIGFLVLYEMFRKSLVIKNLYIKNIEDLKILNVVDKNVKYVILTNLLENQCLISEVKLILPEIEIAHIEYEDPDNVLKQMKDLNQKYNNTKIFIVEKTTKDDRITYIIDYLRKKEYVSVSNISLGNIISNSTALEQIGRKYPEINVYTTKVL
uniref:Uracil phosphoribosyltransferase n=1 Tax=Polysiphonia sertularioides TaxID=945028 RepID=A0A1Z1MGX7_9FLOR|nr:uracil phosphoribosyltransferase [Polysiphonia sertularioides]